MNTAWKNYVIAAIVVIAIIGVALLVMPISYGNRAADAENFVIQAKDNCAVTMDNGFKSIVQMAQVDSNTKQFLKDLIDKATPEQKADMTEAYGQFVNGNTQPMFLMFGVMSGTNFTATAENVQREISAQRSAMLVCSTTLNASQAQLKSIVGMDASGRIVKWPQSMLHLDYPSIISDGSLQDNDHDGKLTVLDYRAPVSVNIREAFGTGEGIDSPELYPTAQP